MLDHFQTLAEITFQPMSSASARDSLPECNRNRLRCNWSILLGRQMENQSVLDTKILTLAYRFCIRISFYKDYLSWGMNIMHLTHEFPGPDVRHKSTTQFFCSRRSFNFSFFFIFLFLIDSFFSGFCSETKRFRVSHHSVISQWRTTFEGLCCRPVLLRSWLVKNLAFILSSWMKGWLLRASELLHYDRSDAERWHITKLV